MSAQLKFYRRFIAIILVVSIFSCNNTETTNETPKPADTTSVAAFEAFKLLMIKHPVADFSKWKTAYIAHDSFRLAHGVSQYVIGRGLDDSNVVVIMDKITDVQKAKDFTATPDLKNAMQKAGVTGPPAFSYVEVVRNDDSKIEQKDRLMIAHKVKDFSAWLKVYDEEGKATRAENGMLDRGLARSVDDSNMVYIVFAITDMAKAKARLENEALKKLMLDAGVIGKPEFFFYKRVD